MCLSTLDLPAMVLLNTAIDHNKPSFTTEKQRTFVLLLIRLLAFSLLERFLLFLAHLNSYYRPLSTQFSTAKKFRQKGMFCKFARQGISYIRNQKENQSFNHTNIYSVIMFNKYNDKIIFLIMFLKYCL